METKERIDYQTLVSRADIHYHSPALIPEHGLPTGNGRMGSMVWTEHGTLNFQINRVDVFAADSYAESGVDYCGGCGKIRVDLGGCAFEASESFEQHLSLYDGCISVAGNGVEAKIISWVDGDVMAIRIKDKRPLKFPIKIDLIQLRASTMGKTWIHQSSSSFRKSDDKMQLTQEFKEKEFLCRTALCVGVAGASIDRELSGSNVNHFYSSLFITPGSEAITVFISSTACFHDEQDVAQEALAKVTQAEKIGFDAMLAGNQVWWADFWRKSYIHLHSGDGAADFLERCNTYHLYLMASSSRGAFPPKFNGMIWTTNGDERDWGLRYWLFNEEAMYYPLGAANHLELTDAFFRCTETWWRTGL